MGQAAVDLPDPLESSATPPAPGQAQSADDLLSKLAGEEIDRLLAESGDEDTDEPLAELPAPPLAATQIEAPPPVEAKKSALEEEMDLDAAIDAAARERSVMHEAEQQADTSPQIDLGDSIRRLPFFLRPLEWLSSPLDPWPDQLRDLLGKIGLMTMINALAVIAYVLIFRRHHH